jgi:hypothetical protein
VKALDLQQARRSPKSKSLKTCSDRNIAASHLRAQRRHCHRGETRKGKQIFDTQTSVITNRRRKPMLLTTLILCAWAGSKGKLAAGRFDPRAFARGLITAR